MLQDESRVYDVHLGISVCSKGSYFYWQMMAQLSILTQGAMGTSIRASRTIFLLPFAFTF